MRQSHGITLIEVLVIVAILYIGVMLMMVSNRETHRCSKRTSCASNMSQLGKAMIMYADQPGNGMYPTLALKGENPYSDGDSQAALCLLYRSYINDIRVFSCSTTPLNTALLATIEPSAFRSNPVRFSEEPRGVAGRSSSFGYSPGHTQDQGQVITLADRQGIGPKGNSDNHGRDAGQNCLAAGGNVEFRGTVINKMGKDDHDIEIYDTDIYSNATVYPPSAKEYESFCR